MLFRSQLEIKGSMIANLSTGASASASVSPMLLSLQKYGGILEFLKSHKIEELEKL